MKLAVVFLLAAIPVCCYASGSGCNAMDDAIAKTIDGSLTVSEYLTSLEDYLFLPYDKASMSQLKQCFLDQTEETLANVDVMVEAIYNSPECSQSS